MAPPRKAPQVPGETPDKDADIVDVLEESAPTGLPHAADIDPTTLTKSVLTADGWVCPA